MTEVIKGKKPKKPSKVIKVKPEKTAKDEKPTKAEKHADKLVFPEFDDIKVSTKTFIVMTNMMLDIDKLFNFLPITEYVVIPKKRGRKKKIDTSSVNDDIAQGSIITLEYQNKIRGVNLKKKKKVKPTVTKSRDNYFRNSVTVVMMIDNKKINYKVSRNGKFQMTGCKFDEHAEKCVKYFWNYIKDTTDIYKLYTHKSAKDEKLKVGLKSDEKVNDPEKEISVLEAIFVPAMCNIDFSLNFFINREKLDEYFNTFTDYVSLLETSFGYTGVNIKIPMKKSIQELKLSKFSFDLKKGNWREVEQVCFNDYLDLLPEKDVIKKLKKLRFNTFLVFHSGSCILSSIDKSFMKNIYYEFLDIIRACYHIIEERLDEE